MKAWDSVVPIIEDFSAFAAKRTINFITLEVRTKILKWTWIDDVYDFKDFLKLTFGINFIYLKQAGHRTSKGSGSCFKKYSLRLAQNSRCSPFCHRFSVVHNLHIGHLIFRLCFATTNPIHPQTKQTLNEKAEVIKVTQRMKSMGSLLSALADIVHKNNLDGFRFIPYCFWWSPLSTVRCFLK